jgi:hypothetical protein
MEVRIKLFTATNQFFKVQHRYINLLDQTVQEKSKQHQVFLLQAKIPLQPIFLLQLVFQKLFIPQEVLLR